MIGDPTFIIVLRHSYINEWLSGYYSCRNILINYNNIPDNYIIATLNNFNKCYIMNIGIDKKYCRTFKQSSYVF